MNTRFDVLFVFVLTLLVSSPFSVRAEMKHSAEAEQGEKTAFSDHLTLVEKWRSEQRIPTIGVGVIRGNRLNSVNVYGHLESGEPAPYNTLFNVASLTKPITAMVALTLVSQDKWSLDAPLSDYWVDPDIAADPRAKQITTRHVLGHQTGFANWRDRSPSAKLSFAFDPGKGYQYSGEGFEYLRRALEAKFKKPLDVLAQELLFSDIGMSDTEFFISDKTDLSRYADNYSSDGTIYGKVQNTKVNAADDLLTTVQDYSKFLVALLKGKGLTTNVFQELSSKQTVINTHKSFGLGLNLYHFDDGEIAISHSGGDNGVKTIFVLLPASGDGLLILTNSDHGYLVYAELFEHYLGRYGKRIFEIETQK